MRRLYEGGVAGFYEVVLSRQGWRVEANKTIRWQIEDKTSGIDQILPSMRTDIVLEHPHLRVRTVIDTKFTSILKPRRYRNASLQSGYLYQIYAYLRTQERNADPLSLNAVGLLLHPSIGTMMNEAVTIQGHKLRFATVDLSASASETRQQLLRVVDADHELPGQFRHPDASPPPS